MPKKSRHVIPGQGGNWVVRKSDSSRAGRVFSTKQEAIGYAKDVVRKEKGDLYVHRRDGTIMEKNTYGNDPLPPRDKRK